MVGKLIKPYAYFMLQGIREKKIKNRFGVTKENAEEVATFIIASIIAFLPLQYFIMTKMWPGMLSSMSSFFYFKVTPAVLLSIVIIGTLTCLITNMIHVKHVRNIAMTEALKNRE